MKEKCSNKFSAHQEGGTPAVLTLPNASHSYWVQFIYLVLHSCPHLRLFFKKEIHFTNPLHDFHGVKGLINGKINSESSYRH